MMFRTEREEGPRRRSAPNDEVGFGRANVQDHA